MIQTEMYDPIIEDINTEIERAKSFNEIIVKPEKQQATYDKFCAETIYKSCVSKLDISVWESQEQIIFSERFISLEEHYYGLVEVNPKYVHSAQKIKQSIIAAKEELDVPTFLSDLLRNKLRELPLILSEQINGLKNSSRFPCCEDIDIIIQGLINHYNVVINSPDKQINYFMAEIQLNKRLSDLMTLGVIQTLQKVLEIRQQTKINLAINELPKRDDYQTKHKLIWRGKQKELVELIVELQSKGWIAEIPVGSLSKAAREITSVFDLTGTDKSFSQILKGEMLDGKRTYDKIYGKRYKQKFNEIKENR